MTPALHVTTRREWRGGEQQLLHLAAATGPVACPPDAALAARLPPGHLRPVAFRGGWVGRAGLRAAVAGEGRLDLLAVHDANALRLALGLGPPVVAHRRVDFAVSWFAARRLRACAGVVAVSEAVRTVLRQAGVDRVEVVRDGVEPPAGAADPGLRAELGLPPGARLVVAVGALVPHKDHATLVRALPELPGVHVALLGEGPLAAPLRALAAASHVAGRLHLPGFRTDVGRWVRSADAVAHPSREEGLGQAVLEAVAAGAAVVVSDAGGLPEIEGVAARFPRGDAAALAAALRRALSGPRPPPAAVRAPGDMVADTREAWRSLVGG